MTRIVLVRHGRAAASWTEDADPGLDETGHHQAQAMAEALGSMGPLPVVTSPLRRTRETAAALERAWATTAGIEPGVGEIPSPDLDVAERGAWLSDVMASRWNDLGDDLVAWRDHVVETLLAMPGDHVVVTHFVAINAAVGVATGDDRVVCFSPDHCSRTTLECTGEGLRVVEWGAQAETSVR